MDNIGIDIIKKSDGTYSYLVYTEGDAFISLGNGEAEGLAQVMKNVNIIVERNMG